ncbi:MAG: peptidase S8 and S53 subtilisin kexin sedolisin [Variovorax sp.]|nr:MAG: peptidase S8 and S53 subtilisin kexin sedolisin [Variovorax sp.]
MRKKNKVNPMDDGVRKLDPKLRMIANGQTEVNIVRAERCAAIAVSTSCQIGTKPLSMECILWREPQGALPPRGKVAKPSSEILANVFISTSTMDRLPPSQVTETRRIGSLATAMVKLSDIPAIARNLSVRQVSLGQSLRDPRPVRATVPSAAPMPTLRKVGDARLHRYGKGVLVGLIDVEGFDFAHPDFLDAHGKTRFHAIWDQGAEPDGSAAPYPYGRVIDRARMNAAIAAAPRVGAPAVELEPQTQRKPSAHGTHVASIACGNSGVAREATIAAVLISAGDEDADPRRSFYDSTRLAHAVDYLFALGTELGLPVSINVSLGTNGHAHDASAPVNRWVDALLNQPGRSVCVAAGNSGQEAPAEPGDLGWVMGRIHTSGRIAAAGLDVDIEWIVVGRAGKDYSENELELWFSPQDRVAVSLRTPDGVWIGPVEPRQFVENRGLADGSFVSLYNERYHPANGANYIGIYLSPNMRASPIVGVAAGQWTVRLHSREIRDGRYHGWVERDDPRPLPPTPGMPEPLAFPSFFSERSNVDRSSISTFACAGWIVAVANLDAMRERVHISSSQGPTRDDRPKPEIAAPGTDIVAACGFCGEGVRWISMTGTSMASPFVCGVVALMLAVQPELTAAQIAGMLKSTAKPLPGDDFAWQHDAGFGIIDPEACVREAAQVNLREDRTR